MYGSDASTDTLLDRLAQSRFRDLSIVDSQNERLERCGLTFGFSRTTRRNPGAEPMVTEQLDYVVDGAHYSLVYRHPHGPPDPAIEHLLRAACPDDLLFATPPSGWSAKPGIGLAASWAPRQRPATGTFELVQLFARGGTEATDGVAMFSGFRATKTRQETSCGLPILVADGTTNMGPLSFDTTIAASQYANRVYAAAYIRTKGRNDSTIQAALQTVCARAAFPRPTFAPMPGTAVLPTPGPKIALPIKRPTSFRITFTTKRGGAAPTTTTYVQTYADDDHHDTIITRTGYPQTAVSENIDIGRDEYSKVDGTWYKHPLQFSTLGGLYPAFEEWQGTLERKPDESNGATTLHIAEFSDRGNRSRVAFGSDGIIRSYDVHGQPSPLSPGGYDEHSDITDIGASFVITPPERFVDASRCSEYLQTTHAIHPVDPVYPQYGPVLKHNVDTWITVTVDADGHLTNAVIAKSSGFTILDNAALAAAHATTFAGGRIFCTPATTTDTYRISFLAN
jgi:TonB family protein